jgi:hypothetical protein
MNKLSFALILALPLVGLGSYLFGYKNGGGGVGSIRIVSSLNSKSEAVEFFGEPNTTTYTPIYFTKEEKDYNKEPAMLLSKSSGFSFVEKLNYDHYSILLSHDDLVIGMEFQGVYFYFKSFK